MTPALQQHLQAWLQEDLGRGDLSAAALQGCRGQAHWIAKPMVCSVAGSWPQPCLA